MDKDTITPAEITAIRKAMGLTVVAFADYLGVNPATVFRWVAAQKKTDPKNPQGAALKALLRLKRRYLQ